MTQVATSTNQLRGSALGAVIAGVAAEIVGDPPVWFVPFALGYAGMAVLLSFVASAIERGQR